MLSFTLMLDIFFILKEHKILFALSTTLSSNKQNMLKPSLTGRLYFMVYVLACLFHICLNYIFYFAKLKKKNCELPKKKKKRKKKFGKLNLKTREKAFKT